MTTFAEQSPSSSHSDARALPDSLEKQFEVLTLDYERTLGLADAIARTRVTMRGIATTAYLAFLGLAVQQHSWALAIAAAVAALAFGCNDAHEGWLYHQLVRRANRLERLFQHRLQALDLPYDPYPVSRLRMELEGYEFGPLGLLPHFRPARLRETLSKESIAVYGAPIVAAAIVALLV